MARELGGQVQEGRDIRLPGLIHADAWQKPTQYCKVVILQFKKKKNIHDSIMQRKLTRNTLKYIFSLFLC